MVIDALNIIKLNRGDCAQIPLFINIGTDEEPVRLDFNKFKDLDIEVYLGVYAPNSKFEHSIIRKKFTYLDANNLGDIIIKIEPQDTFMLYPGKYYYQIKARMEDPIQGEWISTIVDKQEFYIL